MELRVLNGRHAGARANVRGGESIGAGDTCDLVLSDIGIGEDVAAWLWLKSGAWKLSSQHPDAASVEAQEQADDADVHELGSVAFLGDVALTVCMPDSPWQTAPSASAAAAKSMERKAALIDAQHKDAVNQALEQAPEASQDIAAEAVSTQPVDASEQSPQKRRKIPVWWMVAFVLLLLLVIGLWSLLRMGAAPRGEMPSAVEQGARAGTVSGEASQKSVRDAQLAVASVDPALRLQIDPLPDGRVRVAGWVANIDQLDRLAEKLSALRPLPQLTVRAVADLKDDLNEAARESNIRKPAFELQGSGRVKLLGVVLDEAARDKALQSVRASLPKSLEIEDGLRVASGQGAALEAWLKSAGFAGAKAQWVDGRMRLSLTLEAQDRARLERVLARSDNPLADLPFTLQVLEPAVSESPRARSAPAQKLIHVSAAPLPFRIRSVVGGANPYVVLGDGAVLQVGGQRGGWRLDSVDSDRLSLSGPRTLVLAR